MQANKFGSKAIVLVENVGLVIIAIATVFAVGIEVTFMISERTVSLADILLLFIYLEVFSMISIYLSSGKLPVRMPLYIAIVSLARYLILDMKSMDSWRMLGVSGAILLIAIAILSHRYGRAKFPYEENN